MAFCVVCGREGLTLEGQCEEDFRRTHILLRAPEHIDVARCVHCGRLEIGGRWVERTVEDAIPGLLAARVERDPHVTDVRFTYEAREEDAKNLAVAAKAECTVGPWRMASELRTRIRVHNGQCPTGSRQAGRFYVGTVQVRADGRALTEEEARRVQEITARSASGGEFVTELEAVRGGYDVRVSSNAFAKRLAQDLAKSLGGTVGSSATLHTQREGKEQYRATYAVRVAGFREGDTVLWRRGRYRVVAVGDPVRLEDAKTGERVRVRLRELRSARVLRE